jgi:L-ascorbate metabolism protein UlaG (beta-lactamase superfamily)
MSLASRISIFYLFIFLVGCTSHYKGPISDHFDGERFKHPWSEDEKSFFTLLKWKWTSSPADWPKSVEVPLQKVPDLQRSLSKVSVTFINHATVYIQAYGLRFLTDPQWSDRASPVSFLGPKRAINPGVAIDQLPGVDFVMISHNHYDHFDLPTIQRLNELYKPQFYIPLGDGHLMQQLNIQNFTELDWWKPMVLSENLSMTFVPVKHWSARGFGDRNKSLWGGYVLESTSTEKKYKIFFAGDTGYCSIFSELSQKYGEFDLAFLPIGAYEPRWFMRDAHMNPADAVQAHLDLKSKYSVGIHWGVWQLTDEGIEEPLQELKKSLQTQHVQESKFETYQVGVTKEIQ